MTQLERIEAMVEQRWSLKKKNKEEDEDNKERSEDSPEESQKEIEERIPSSAFYLNKVLYCFFLYFEFHLFLVVSNCMSKKLRD